MPCANNVLKILSRSVSEDRHARNEHYRPKYTFPWNHCGTFAAFVATTVPTLSWTLSRITEPARLDGWLLDICVSNLSDP
jgi:hypothetical protein